MYGRTELDETKVEVEKEPWEDHEIRYKLFVTEVVYMYPLKHPKFRYCNSSTHHGYMLWGYHGRFVTPFGHVALRPELYYSIRVVELGAMIALMGYRLECLVVVTDAGPTPEVLGVHRGTQMRRCRDSVDMWWVTQSEF